MDLLVSSMSSSAYDPSGRLPFSIDDNESSYGTFLGTVGPYPDVSPIVLYSFKLDSLTVWVGRLQ